jgi:hypothetical protein
LDGGSDESGTQTESQRDKSKSCKVVAAEKRDSEEFE